VFGRAAACTVCSITPISDIALLRCCPIEAGSAIRECSYDAGSTSDLPHDPLERVVGPDLVPMEDVGDDELHTAEAYAVFSGYVFERGGS
jgi:hypothetical protein